MTRRVLVLGGGFAGVSTARSPRWGPQSSRYSVAAFQTTVREAGQPWTAQCATEEAVLAEWGRGAACQPAGERLQVPHPLDSNPASVGLMVTIPGPKISLARISLIVLPKPLSRAQ